VTPWDDALSVPLGVVEGQEFRASHRPLRPGDTLVVLTDGVLDAQSPGGERFGEARALAAVAGAPPEPERLVRALTAEVSRFAAGTPLADDVTVLAVAPRRGAGGP
jgi:serine phosphatase RsbU (regulator of sigma subunit)